MAETREEGLAMGAKWRLLEKLIVETGSGNIEWKYAFNEMFDDYYAEWQGRILTIRSLQDESPRLRVFASAEEGLITYDPDRKAIILPVEDDALVTCWEWELSGMNRLLCSAIAAYLNPKEDQPEEEVERSSQEKKKIEAREQRRQAEMKRRKERAIEELKRIKEILGG